MSYKVVRVVLLLEDSGLYAPGKIELVAGGLIGSKSDYRAVGAKSRKCSCGGAALCHCQDSCRIKVVGGGHCRMGYRIGDRGNVKVSASVLPYMDIFLQKKGI